MDAAELGRRRAADLHEQAVTIGMDPRLAYAFVLAEAKLLCLEFVIAIV